MVNVVSVRFEHHHSPALGIGECEPRISWSFEGDDRNWAQASYELEVMRENKSPETYLVPSPDCQLVPWPSQPLHSRERAEVRVRVTDKSGVVSGWSEAAAVE